MRLDGKAGYVGKMSPRSMPFRNPKNKWYISEKQWPKKNGYYPTFAFGPGYAMRSDAISCILNTMGNPKSLAATMTLEDVYMGIIANECKIETAHIDGIYPFVQTWEQEAKKVAGRKVSFVVVHYVEASAMSMFYHLLSGTLDTSDPRAMCLYQEPIGKNAVSSGSCAAVGNSPSWTVYSKNKACEGPEVQKKRITFATNAGTFDCCKQFCEITCGCVAIDYFATSGWCNLYHTPCSTPTKTADGGSSYLLQRPGGGVLAVAGPAATPNAPAEGVPPMKMETQKTAGQWDCSSAHSKLKDENEKLKEALKAMEAKIREFALHQTTKKKCLII